MKRSVLVLMVEKNLKCNSNNRINCTGCTLSYAGITTQNFISRTKEYFLPDDIMTKHKRVCGNQFTCGEIFGKTSHHIVYLSILDALHIRENKPILNVKDAFRGRLLRIQIRRKKNHFPYFDAFCTYGKLSYEL